MKRCAIVGAGDFFAERFEKESYDMIIAADGGYESLIKIGVTPHLLIGDFDSITDIPKGVNIIKHPVEKDETDMHLAYLEGAKSGCDEFHVFGGVGGRQDHTFANYSLLMYAKSDNNQMYLYDRDMYSFMLHNEKITLTGRRGDSISVFAFGGECRGVSINGLKYEADNITVSPHFPIGVSNSFTGVPATVEVGHGFLLIMREY